MLSKVKEQEESKKLRAEGWSIKEIQRKLQVSKSSVSVWVRNIQLSSLQKKKLIKKEQLGGLKGRKKQQEYWKNYHLKCPKPTKTPRWPQRDSEAFFDKWSPNMAYVLGYFASDGSMYKNNRGSCYISFTSADIELIYLVKQIMGATNQIEIYQPRGNRKLRYALQIGSKILFNRLLALDLTPNKSLTLQLPSVPDEFLGHFFRGYFDGDGCAYLRYHSRSNRKNRLYRSFSLGLTSGSRGFLEALHERVSEVAKVQGGSLSAHSGAFVLSYSTHNVIKLFSWMYPRLDTPCLRRKRDILEKGMGNWGRSSTG